MNEDAEEIDDLDDAQDCATDDEPTVHEILGALAANALAAGYVPGYLVVSERIFRAAGWKNVAQRDDRGRYHLLGMQVQLTHRNILYASMGVPDEKLLVQLQQYEPYARDGGIYLKELEP